MNANLFAAFAARLSVTPERPFLLLPDGRTLTRGEVLAESARLANWLAAMQLPRGARVSVQADKSVTYLLLYFACVRAGLVFHPLNPAYTPAELAYFLENAAPAMFVGDPAGTDALALAERLGIRHRHTLDVQGAGSLVDASASFGSDFDTVEVGAGDMAALLYSSGTTGRPKGIVLTHGNLLANARALKEAWGFTEQDVLLHALPLFHVHGLFIAMGCALLSGAQVIFQPRFETSSVLEALPQSTVFMGVPTYYTRLLAEPGFGPAQAPSVRLFVSGSAPLLPETFKEFSERMGQPILERYGMTECGVIASNPLHGARKAGAVGPALPGMEVRVVDEAGATVGVGGTGHVQVRGESVFREYWQLPEKTAEDITPDGFFNTGDDGRLDEDGYLHLVGRSKDLIITGGLNVYPSEVEAVLDGLPDVLESAVVGLPHPDFGEQVVAVIVTRAHAMFDEAAARVVLRNELAGYKQPKRYVVLEALPRNAMGKVQKNLLRERLG